MFYKICITLFSLFLGFVVGFVVTLKKESIDVEIKTVSKVGFEWVGRDDGVNGHTDHYWIIFAGEPNIKYMCSKEDYKMISITDCKYEFYIHRRLFDSSYRFVHLKRIVK